MTASEGTGVLDAAARLPGALGFLVLGQPGQGLVNRGLDLGRNGLVVAGVGSRATGGRGCAGAEEQGRTRESEHDRRAQRPMRVSGGYRNGPIRGERERVIDSGISLLACSVLLRVLCRHRARRVACWLGTHNANTAILVR